MEVNVFVVVQIAVIGLNGFFAARVSGLEFGELLIAYPSCNQSRTHAFELTHHLKHFNHVEKGWCFYETPSFRDLRG